MYKHELSFLEDQYKFIFNIIRNGLATKENAQLLRTSIDTFIEKAHELLEKNSKSLETAKKELEKIKESIDEIQKNIDRVKNEIDHARHNRTVILLSFYKASIRLIEAYEYDLDRERSALRSTTNLISTLEFNETVVSKMLNDIVQISKRTDQLCYFLDHGAKIFYFSDYKKDKT